MYPFRIAILVFAVFLVVLCVWVVVRLLIELGWAAARGLRMLVCSDPPPDLSLRPPGALGAHGSPHRPGRAQQPPGLSGASPRMCARPRCRWVNRPGARFCAQCGQPLAVTVARRAV